MKVIIEKGRKNSGFNVCKISKFDSRSLNVKCYSIQASIVRRSTSFNDESNIEPYPFLPERPLTFHHPNSFHSKCKGPNQRISSARREYSVNQMDNNGYLFFSKEEATMHWPRVAKMYNTVRVFLSFKLPYDDRFSASTMFMYLSNYSFIEILFEEMELIIIYTLA